MKIEQVCTVPSYCEGIVFDRPASENAEEIFADNSGAKLIGKSRRLAIGEARTLMHGRQPGPPVLPEPTARSSSACPVLMAEGSIGDEVGHPFYSFSPLPGTDGLRR